MVENVPNEKFMVSYNGKVGNNKFFKNTDMLSRGYG